MTNAITPTEMTPEANFEYIEVALDIILHSDSLADLCERAVTLPQVNGIFSGAHVLLNTDDRLSYDSGYGQLLPINHLEIAKAAIASSNLEFRQETPTSPAMVAIPFMRHGYAEAVGILIMSPGEPLSHLQGHLEPILTKLTGFYLESKYGLGH